MKKNLSLALVQFDPFWENPKDNSELLDKLILNTQDGLDIIVLPEMFLTGFSMNTSKIAEEMDGFGVNWMKRKASDFNTTMIGSLPIRDNDKIYNRLLSVSGSECLIYDKRHLFRMGEEHTYYQSGNKKIIVHKNGWKILPLTCYDLRFPVWSRNINCSYDVLIYIANWPEARKEAFVTLLKARAIENQCYVIAVNRVGKDGNGLTYAGNSLAIDPKGKIISDLPEGQSGIIEVSLNYEDLDTFRKKFPVYLDADEFIISA